jgi:hypothetical protein
MRKSKYIGGGSKKIKNGEENLAEAREKLLLKTGGSNRHFGGWCKGTGEVAE